MNDTVSLKRDGPVLTITITRENRRNALNAEVAEGITAPIPGSPATVLIEHPVGTMEVLVQYQTDPFAFISAGVTRTARMIARGEVMVPDQVWNAQ